MFAPPGLVRQAVEGGGPGNAANPGRHGLQNTRSRHAAQTVEVVRNHEDGTSGERGSELPKGRPGFGRERAGSVQALTVLVIPGGGRATVTSAAGHERTNPRRGGSGESRTQRSRGALKKRPSSRGQHPRFHYEPTRVLWHEEDPEGQPATAKAERGATKPR